MTDTVLLTCPIRGPLNVSKLAVDGLTTSEEHHRISFIKFLLKKGYSKDHITVETTLIKNLGESGRNKLRADVIVYDQPASIANKLPQEEKLKNI
ncbi:type I restriction enzyme HsdR N-terminal domain-containing protein, partial [Vibrio parahaemolyticus]|nr:type I restriction enzyme HsdR N-terminal domain-containing protein [Vibrio parahaemolyticus]